MKKQVRRLVVLALVVGMLATSVLGTSAAFDPVYYAAQNPDVVKALGNSPAMLKLHYDMFGRKEARMSNKNDVEGQLRRLFNADDYAKLFPDVKKVFGDDKEAMFNHYIAFGLLEGRRPSEKVSQATAVSLKKTVEKAMKEAGLAATPGSPEVVAAITGETSSVASAGAAVQQTVAKVADVVAKEVTATVEKAQNPAPAGGGSSSSSQEPIRQTITLGVYTDVATTDDGKHVSNNIGESTDLVLKGDKATGSRKYTGRLTNASIMVTSKNLIKDSNPSQNAYWYVITIPKSVVSGNGDWLRAAYIDTDSKASTAGKWNILGSTPTSHSALNTLATTGDLSGNYVFPIGEEILNNSAPTVTKVAKIALVSGNNITNSTAWSSIDKKIEFEIEVNFTKTVKVFTDVSAGSPNWTLGTEEEAVITGGNGTEDKPYTVNKTFSIVASDKNIRKESDNLYYWHWAVFVPKAYDGTTERSNQYMLFGGKWTKLDSAKIDFSDPDGLKTFYKGFDLYDNLAPTFDPTVTIAISSASDVNSLTDINTTYYKLNVKYIDKRTTKNN